MLQKLALNAVLIWLQVTSPWRNMDLRIQAGMGMDEPDSCPPQAAHIFYGVMSVPFDMWPLEWHDERPCILHLQTALPSKQQYL